MDSYPGGIEWITLDAALIAFHASESPKYRLTDFLMRVWLIIILSTERKYEGIYPECRSGD